MKSNCVVRYASGREERFEVEFFGGASAVDRLKEFVKNPTVVLQSENEVIIIPSTAIECITLGLPDTEGRAVALPGVRKGHRVQSLHSGK
jgi:hypothetical protein